jgi:hypothetical protein
VNVKYWTPVEKVDFSKFRCPHAESCFFVQISVCHRGLERPQGP